MLLATELLYFEDLRMWDFNVRKCILGSEPFFLFRQFDLKFFSPLNEISAKINFIYSMPTAFRIQGMFIFDIEQKFIHDWNKSKPFACLQVVFCGHTGFCWTFYMRYDQIQQRRFCKIWKLYVKYSGEIRLPQISFWVTISINIMHYRNFWYHRGSDFLYFAEIIKPQDIVLTITILTYLFRVWDLGIHRICPPGFLIEGSSIHHQQNINPLL